MTKDAIVIDNPSAHALGVVEKLKEYKEKVLEEMRKQRKLTIDITNK